jgi:hypothetical protein
MTERRLTVRMHQQLSGGRHDGRPWPPAEEPFEVPEWEFADLIRGGMAVPHGRDSESAARDLDLGEHAAPGHPSKLDPRPETQVVAEDLTEDERERYDAGTLSAAEAGAQPGGDRASAADESRARSAQLRAAERESAEAYAEEGVLGAPGSEVPGLYEGDEAVYPAGEGVRPDSQAEAEAPVYEDRAGNEAGASRSGSRRSGRKPGPEPSAAGPGAGSGAQDKGEDQAAAGPAEPAADPGPGHVTAPVTVDVPRGSAPAPSAAKQEWVDYAVSQGADVHAAGNMSKADLMSRYGGRL